LTDVLAHVDVDSRMNVAAQKHRLI